MIGIEMQANALDGQWTTFLKVQTVVRGRMALFTCVGVASDLGESNARAMENAVKLIREVAATKESK